MNEVQRMNIQEFEDALTNSNEKETPALQALVRIMTSPIPKRAGLKLSKEETALWAEELSTVINKLHSILELTYIQTNDLDACNGMINQTRKIIKELII